MVPYRQAREKSGEHLYSDETGCELSQLASYAFVIPALPRKGRNPWNVWSFRRRTGETANPPAADHKLWWELIHCQITSQ